MTEDELFQQFKRSIAKNLESDLIRGHYHNISTAAASETKPDSITLDTFMAAYNKAKQAIDSAPVSVPVDLPDFLRARLWYLASKHVSKIDDDGNLIFYKINQPPLFGFYREPTYIMHPDNVVDFVKAMETYGAFAVDLAAFNHGEVDEYGRPIEKPGE